MVKSKRSFFERITGSRKIEEGEIESMPVFSTEEREETIMATNQPVYPREENWTNPAESEGQLTIDVYQTEDAIVIKSTIAGVKPEDLDVSINNDMVTIRGERKNEEEVTGENYYYQECYWGSFSRSIVLPVDIVSEKAEASLKNGILTIKLPKADVTKSKRIQVRSF
jgi:HSP20 family protein